MALRRQLLPVLAVLVASASAACFAAAQPATAEATPDNTTPGAGIKVSFRPSVAIVVGIFTMIFSLTFLLLMYAKFCHPSSSPLPTASTAAAAAVGVIGNDAAAAAHAGGVPKPVIESLPFFRFAALRGARRGLECAVCLARFDDADHLRLLPRCRHAFHLACVDRWLESSASCPLCRARVDAGDAALGLGLKYPSSARIVFGGDGLSASASGRSRFDGADAGSGRDLLDIFVERVPSARFAGDPKRRAADHDHEEDEASAAERAPPSPEMDRHKHRIIVSDVVFKSRWSELNSADLIGLDTELLRSMSSGRFSLPDSPEFNSDAKLSAAAEEDVDGAVLTTTERKRLLAGGGRCSSSAAVDAAAPAARLVSSGVRSVSEIVSLPRLRGAARERLSEEENRRWLPIARRTARWFAGRAGRGHDDEAVHVAAAHV